MAECSCLPWPLPKRSKLLTYRRYYSAMTDRSAVRTTKALADVFGSAGFIAFEKVARRKLLQLPHRGTNPEDLAHPTRKPPRTPF